MGQATNQIKELLYAALSTHWRAKGFVTLKREIVLRQR
jgi:hypothetical protein